MPGRASAPPEMDDTPPDVSAATAHRSRALRSGILGSLGIRAVAVVGPLLLIPVAIDHLGTSLFGLWVTLAAVTSVATFSDLGMGNGLLTLLPKALADGETDHARGLVSSAYALLAAVSASAIALLALTFPYVPWEAVFDPDATLDQSRVRLVVGVSLALTALAAPLNLSLRLYYATQRAHLAALWTSVSVLAPLIPVLVAVRVDTDPFLVVVLLIAAGPVTQLVASLWFFIRVAPELRPGPRLASWRLVRRLFRLGSLFLGLSVALVLSTSLDNVVLAQSVGLASVTAYAIPAKVFAQLAQAMTLLSLPLWAATGDAIARGDSAWVRRATGWMVSASAGAAALAGLAAVVAGPPALRAWLGHPVPLPTSVLLGLALATTVTAALSPLFMVLNAAGVVVPQIIGWGAFALITLPLKYFATDAWGYETLPWVTLLGLLALVAPSCVVAATRVVRSLPKESEG